MRTLFDWLEKRTGLRTKLRRARERKIPRRLLGPYLWASATAFLFVILAVTGILMMTLYSPSATTAWGSVWYMQTQTTLGWFIRGVHYVASNLLILVAFLGALDLLVRKLYRRPGEILWWASLAILLTIAGLSLTGFLLPWDQRGYWSTNVRVNILALTPLVGPALRALILGGSDLGQASLTRFYTLHVALLPLVFAMLWVVRGQQLSLLSNALSTTSDRTPSSSTKPLWVSCSLVWAALTIAVLASSWYMHSVWGWTLLDAPADASTSDYPARPEWYALFLFQWLKAFQGHTAEVIGAIVLPGILLVVLLLIPFLDRIIPVRTSHRTILALSGLGLVTVIVLSASAIQEDIDPPMATLEQTQTRQREGQALNARDESILRAGDFNTQRRRADMMSRRAFELASTHGIPPDGPLSLLANDPQTRGPKLFAAHCSSCHRYFGHDGLGNIPAEPATSSDLGAFASREWIRNLLADPTSPYYFGRMKKENGDPAHTRMAKWTQEALADCESEADRRTLSSNFDAVAAYLEDESQHPGQLAAMKPDTVVTSQTATTSHTKNTETGQALLRQGRAFFMAVCNECHAYDGQRSGTRRAPEMKGYGSPQWIARMIATPNDNELYRAHGKEPAQMPPFKGKLSERDRTLIATWLHKAILTNSSARHPLR